MNDIGPRSGFRENPNENSDHSVAVCLQATKFEEPVFGAKALPSSKPVTSKNVY